MLGFAKTYGFCGAQWCSLEACYVFCYTLRDLLNPIGSAFQCFFVLIALSLTSSLRANNLALVGFDVPAVVIAETISPQLVDQPSTGGKFVRIRLPVSAFVSSQFRGEVEEYLVEFESPQQTLRIVDLWPKNEMVSPYEGTIAVDSANQTKAEVSFNASASFEPIARGTAGAKYQRDSSIKERFVRKPPMQLLTSSGTVRRGFGCCFKFRAGLNGELEGARDVAILAEVPQNWRADAMLVSMQATGKVSNQFQSKQLGSAKLWMSIHQAGDPSAAAQAKRFVRFEQSLRALAQNEHKRVEQRAYPSVWHKVGAALDVVEPRIPDDYLSQVIFGPAEQYLEGSAHRLPMNLRVAILDYWQERKNLQALAYGG